MGNAQLFRAVVKFGFIKPKTLSSFMYAFKQMQIEESSSGDLHPTAQEKEELRNRALIARANLKEAKRLNNTEQPKQLSKEQEHLLDQYENKELQRAVLIANTKYGYGAGVHRMSKEEAVHFRMMANSLSDYQRGGDGLNFNHTLQ